MSRLRTQLLIVGALGLVVLTAGLAWRSHAARQQWQALRPALPDPVGVSAPGLDARLAACSSRLQAWPPDRAALAEFARVCHANGLLQPAITAYQALAVLEPAEPRWPHLLASILGSYGRLDEALPLLRRTTALAPDYLPGWLRLGDALFKADATTEAEAAFQEALKRAPGNPYALLGLARCDLQRERWTAARSHLQQAVADDAHFADAQSLLASVFERLGNPEAAAVARGRVVNQGHYIEPPDAWTDELTPYCHNPYTLVVAAAAATSEGTPAKALAPLDRALVLAPDDPRVHRQKAKVLSKLGDMKGARAALEKAVALAPNDENMLIDLVALLRAVKDQAALERAVTAGVAACPNSAGLHYEAGLIAAQAGRLADAAEHFQFTWKNRPEKPAAARELAKVYFRSGRDADGVTVLEKILSITPLDTDTHVLLVQHGIETGDPRTAGWLRRALQSGAPGLPVAEMQQAYLRRFGATIR